MSPIYGDITLINGRINNLKMEVGASLPTFSSSDIGRLYFLNTDGTFVVNDGNEWVTLQFSDSNTSNPLIVTLGTNWINPDRSFNPTPFNNLNNISGLTANDTLFSVISALDSAITGITNQNLADLHDTAFSALQAGDIVYWTGTTFSNISMNSLANARLSMTTNLLKDVQATLPYKTGDILIFSQSSTKFVNRPLFFTYTNTASSNAFSVSHNLGVKFPIVQIINYATNTAITSGYQINYLDNNTLTVTLTTAAPVVIVVSVMNSA